MITRVELKFGRAPGIPPTPILTTPITVFVGPNNSGKSKVLQELSLFCSTGQQNQNNVILNKVTFESLPELKVQVIVQRLATKLNPNEFVQPGSIIMMRFGQRQPLNQSHLLNAIGHPNENTVNFCQWYLATKTLKLDGQHRIALVNEQTAGDLQNPPVSSFQVLFGDDTKREEVRRIIHDAFGLYFIIDPTKLGTLRVRLSTRPPQCSLEERGIHDEARKFHADAMLIDSASDGVKAFTGIITAIIAGDPHILLIDEPEAFLHPSLSFKLGKEIATASSDSEKRLFVSTHSPHFVMGCIQSGAPVNIVRLTYRNGVATARILPNPDILRLMRNPLLRSTRVLDALFYEFVVVTEGDTDRAFYQEINERLVKFKPEWGIPNCLFLNAQNKQTVRTIIKPLRELGIPAAAIVDIDVLKEGGTVWKEFLSCGFMPELDQQSLATGRAAIKQRFDESGKDMKLNGGVDSLRNSDREAANNLFDRLDQYGLFVVRRGELESWLEKLGGIGKKSDWLIDVFEKIGEDPESPTYLRPELGDIWKFIGSVKVWLTNSNRSGIPS